MMGKCLSLIVTALIFCCCVASKEYVSFTGVVKEVRVTTIDEVCACTIFIDVQGQEEIITWVAESLPTSWITAPSRRLENVLCWLLETR